MKKGTKIGIGAAIAAAGIGGILWGIFGGRKKGMSEDDFEIEDAEQFNDADSEETSSES